MLTSAQQAQIHRVSQIGRSSGPELFASTTFAAGSTLIVNRNISIQRPVGVILTRWRGRVVIGTANISPVAAEAPQTIIQNIRIFGTWKGAQQVPVDISGATAYVWHRLYHVYGNSSFFGTTRQADPGMPFGQTGATFGNTGTYDLEIYYRIPVYPNLPQAARASAIVPFLWLPQDWNDSLQIQYTFGDGTSFGTLGSATVTFTAFGSGSGSPVVETSIVYYQLGGLLNSYSSALVVRSEQQTIGGVIGAAGNNQQLQNLSKQKTTNVMVKTGHILLGTSGFVSVFLDLTDTMLNVTQVRVDNKYIRNTYDNLASKEDQARLWDAILPQGYQNFSFIDGANPRACFRADNPQVVGPGANFAVWSNIVTPGSNPAMAIVQEQIYAAPGDPFWTAHSK